MQISLSRLRLPNVVIGAALILLALPACDRNLEPFDPAEEVKAPDLARIFPQDERPGPGLRASVVSPDDALPQLAAQTAEPGAITGTLSLAPDLVGRVPEGGTLFIIARGGAGGGPPLAVRRIPSPRFPLEFSIGPENVMIPGVVFEGDILLSARVDGDGNAMTRNPGDLQGSLAEPVAPGSRVSIVLDERL